LVVLTGSEVAWERRQLVWRAVGVKHADSVSLGEHELFVSICFRMWFGL
jgi:hypothetical protein